MKAFAGICILVLLADSVVQVERGYAMTLIVVFLLSVVVGMAISNIG